MYKTNQIENGIEKHTINMFKLTIKSKYHREWQS